MELPIDLNAATDVALVIFSGTALDIAATQMYAHYGQSPIMKAMKKVNPLAFTRAFRQETGEEPDETIATLDFEYRRRRALTGAAMNSLAGVISGVGTYMLATSNQPELALMVGATSATYWLSSFLLTVIYQKREDIS